MVNKIGVDALGRREFLAGAAAFATAASFAQKPEEIRSVMLHWGLNMWGESLPPDIKGPLALKNVLHFDETMEILKRHDWPGNVRELRNLIEVAFLAAKPPVDLSAFLGLGRFVPAAMKEEADAFLADRPFKDAKDALVGDFERKYVTDLLERYGYNVSQSARAAGIERAYLQRLMKKYAITG